MTRVADRGPATLTVTGRRSPADLLWLANTIHGPAGHWHARPRDDEPDHDHLSTGAAAVRYLADHRVEVPQGEPDAAALADLVVVRQMVRRRLEAGVDPWDDAGRALLADADLAVTPDGTIASRRPGWAGFARDLLVPLLAAGAGPAGTDEAPALRSCANPRCRLVFEDASRNHARRWCDTAGCGNRDRVRRARRASVDPAARPVSRT